ncbi:hypothetical protein [Microcella indica]|uniref:hypothetical protein n=1 Tax=Microcella indica TaxID=2750620 RepID=UPI0015CF34EA|nr:hypothetical protein [Microcella indica]
MMRRHSLTASATLLGVLLMAGCAGSGGTPTSVALSDEQGIPSDAPVSEPWNDSDWRGEPLAWVSDGGDTLTVVTFGSSSCPYIAVRIEMLTARQLAIDFEKGPAEACTDDLAPRTHVFAVPEGVDAASAGLEVEISLADTAFGPAEPTVVSVPVLPLGSAAPEDQAEEPVDSIALEVIRGTPAGIELDEADLERGEPLAFWGEARETIHVVTWGSSGCPPIARSLQPAEPGILVLDFAPNPAEFCTADFAPTTHVLATPEGITTDGIDTDDLALAVTIEERDGTVAEFRVPVRG